MNASVLCLWLAVAQPPHVPVAPMPVLPLVEPIPPLTLCDFCKAFVPLPGNYEVVLLHPVKKCPVKVCFTLPPGCPKVHCGKLKVKFDYGKRAVVIRFKLLGGKYTVTYS
jgi:hypothetical protein